MSVVSKISTFFETTLLCIRAFLLRHFIHCPPCHASSVTSYPLHLTWRTVLSRSAAVRYTASSDGGGVIDKGMDLEKGIFTVVSPSMGQAGWPNVFSQIVGTKTATVKLSTPDAPGTLQAMAKTLFSMKDKILAAPLLTAVMHELGPWSTSEEDDDEYKGINPYSGFVKDEEEPWSKVFCFND
ncbi:hypothetical protein B0H10DRAFT_1951314 [Mycena sp. CBHHK59/15]|nr:hypothetical protein B0H10DRAFT_1951314 [Mycena sp. CBHHK59/15]